MSQHPVVDFSWCSPNRPRPSAKCNGHRELKSLAQWLGLWLGSTKIEVSPKTHERYAEIVRCYLIPGLGDDWIATPYAQRHHSRLCELHTKTIGANSPTYSSD